MREKTSKSRASALSMDQALMAYPVNYKDRITRRRKSKKLISQQCPQYETLCVTFNVEVNPDNPFVRGVVESTMQSLQKRWMEEFGISVINSSTTLFKAQQQTKRRKAF